MSWRTLDVVRRRSLFRRLLGHQLALTAIGWVMFSAFVIYLMFERDRGFLRDDMQLTSQSLSNMVASSGSAPARETLAAQFLALHRESSDPVLLPQEIGYQFWTSDGQLLFKTPAGSATPELPPSRWQGHRPVELPGWLAYGSFDASGRLFAVVAYSDAGIHRLGMRLFKDAVSAFAVISVLMVLIVWMASRRGLEPLHALAAQLQRRRGDDLTHIEPSQAYDYAELAPLVDAINAHMASLRLMIGRERDFFANAAHELRTPLAALEAQAHWLAEARDMPDRHEALAALQSGVQRCASVVQKVLALSRADASIGHVRRVEQDLAEIVRGAIGRQAARVLSRQGSLSYDGPQRLMARVDAEFLSMAMDCLLDNAIVHAGPGAAIEVRVRMEGNACCVEVRDDGPGVPLPAREGLFERFVRGSDTTLGSGLGLSIVRSVAHMHGGEASFVEVAQGCCVRIRWPMS